MTNEEIVSKADLALSDLTSASAVLNTEQAKQFVRKMIVQPTILREARVVGMGAPSRRINKIGFGSRILHYTGNEAALSSGNRSKPTFESIDLTAKQFKAEVRLPYETLEDAIESTQAANNEASNDGPGGLRDTILALISEQVAADSEEIALLSDTGSGDADLASQHGWLKIANASGNVVSAAGATISQNLFKEGKKAIPNKYLRQVDAMRHMISPDKETDYRSVVASRQTGGGDSALDGNAPLRAFGAQIRPISQMPDAKGLFCNPLNLIFGIWRRISIEFDKEITAGQYIIVLSTRVAFAIEEPEAVVNYTNIG